MWTLSSLSKVSGIYWLADKMAEVETGFLGKYHISTSWFQRSSRPIRKLHCVQGRVCLGSPAKFILAFRSQKHLHVPLNSLAKPRHAGSGKGYKQMEFLSLFILISTHCCGPKIIPHEGNPLLYLPNHLVVCQLLREKRQILGDA